jgi:5-methyltetrahydrofolate--homocysteine methyltransferase
VDLTRALLAANAPRLVLTFLHYSRLSGVATLREATRFRLAGLQQLARDSGLDSRDFDLNSIARVLSMYVEDAKVGKSAAAAKDVKDSGMPPERMLFEALIPSLEEVGARFERGDWFVPEMLVAGKAMAGALDLLRPLLAQTGVESVGTVLMGTVKGDVHDIGKNLVNIMLEGAGFTVIDLGVQVPPEKFVAAIEEHQPDIVGMSAFLTTTMPMFKANINAIEKAGLRDKVVIMVGGAPVTQEYADVCGADGYAADAATAVRRAKEFVTARRAAR